MTRMRDQASDRPIPAGAPAPAGPTYWEPWSPTVGQPVRVHLSAECAQELVSEGRVSGLVEPLTGHPVALDGQPGVVVRVEQRDNAHRFYVQFDPPVRRSPGRMTGSAVFAACELVPVDVGEGEGKRRCARSVQW